MDSAIKPLGNLLGLERRKGQSVFYFYSPRITRSCFLCGLNPRCGLYTQPPSPSCPLYSAPGRTPQSENRPVGSARSLVLQGGSESTQLHANPQAGGFMNLRARHSFRSQLPKFARSNGQ